MSYTPENQNIEIPIHDMLTAMEELNKAIGNRIKNGERWSNLHILEINELRKELMDLETKLREFI